MKIEVNTVRSSRGDLSNQLPAAAVRCLRSNRCKSKGNPGTAVPWRVDEEAKGIGSPGPLLLESSGDASLRARRDKWEREPPAARAGSLFIRARLVGLVCRCWNRVFGCSLQGGERRWEASVYVTARHDGSARASAGGDRASQRPLNLAGAGSMEAQRPPDGINHRGRTAAAGAGRSFRCRDRRTSTSGDRAVGECGTRAAAWAWPATEPSSTKLAHEEEEGSRNQPKTARKMRKARGFFFRWPKGSKLPTVELG